MKKTLGRPKKAAEEAQESMHGTETVKVYVAPSMVVETPDSEELHDSKYWRLNDYGVWEKR